MTQYRPEVFKCLQDFVKSRDFSKAFPFAQLADAVGKSHFHFKLFLTTHLAGGFTIQKAPPMADVYNWIIL